MNAAQSATFPARPAEAFVHIDNRALVLSNGRDTVMFPEGALRYVAETLEVLHREGRATRKQSMATIVGGFRLPDGGVTLYAGAADRLIAISLEAGAFDALRASLEAPGATGG